MQTGGVFAGKVVFDAEKAPVPTELTTIRIGASVVGGGYIAQTGSTRVGTALSASLRQSERRWDLPHHRPWTDAVLRDLSAAGKSRVDLEASIGAWPAAAICSTRSSTGRL
jgi:hypothetical protein